MMTHSIEKSFLIDSLTTNNAIHLDSLSLSKKYYDLIVIKLWARNSVRIRGHSKSTFAQNFFK